MGRRAGGDLRPADEVDERRREDGPPRLLGQRLLLGAPSRIGRGRPGGGAVRRGCLVVCFLASCSPAPVPKGLGQESGRITQISVINALMIGRYDGVLPVRELLRRGDFGVGTLD